MDNANLFAALVLSAWALAALLVLAFVGWCLFHRYSAGTHEGASLDSTVVLELPTEDKPTGRHHVGAVKDVPDTYRPHIGRRLIARETDTQRIEYPR